ncbi:MAG: hypothetical protein QM759_06720 [Terricaulis sp.]
MTGGQKGVWGQRRFIAYVGVAILLGALASNEAWIAHKAVVASLDPYNFSKSTVAVSELQLAARSFLPLSLLSPALLTWALFDYVLTPVRGRFTVWLVILTLLVVVTMLAALLFLFAGSVARGETSAVLAAMIALGNATLIASMLFGVWWLASVGGRIRKIEDAEVGEPSWPD